MIWDTEPVRHALVSPCPKQPGCWYDAPAAETAVNFFPWFCRFSAGKKAGSPFHLEPWQAWIVRQAYGWRRRDGRRLYRRVMIWVPRKNGKTELLAGVSHISLTALGALGGEVYSIAAHAEQAGIVFRAAQQMATYSPALAANYELRKGSIYCPALHTVFRPLSGQPHGKHGLKCLVLLGDEAHEWKDGDLYQFVRQSMGTWEEPMEWIISTAGLSEGYGLELWDECEKIADGSLDDPETLVVMFRADPEKDDLADPKVWAKANPNLGVSLEREWFASEVKKALQLPRHLNYVKRYHFNIWTSHEVRWLPADEWNACNSHPTDADYWRRLEHEMTGRPCWGGLDLASTRDTNALVWVFPPAGADDRFVVLPRFWWPRASAEAQMRSARIPIAKWEHEGAITLTDGNTADHDSILAQVLEDGARFKVMGLGVDRWNSHQITVDMVSAGVPAVIVEQRMATLSAPAKKLERLVLDGELDHGGHPVLRWQAANAAVRSDDQENIMPAKRRSTGKIDGIAALVTALAVETSGAAADNTYRGYMTASELTIA